MNPLLADILANPEDDEPRRVYADVLLEKGDPRGEFINVQLDLARIAEGDERAHKLGARERRLLKDNKMKWTLGIRGVEFTRGFIESLSFKLDQLSVFEPLLAIEPIFEINLNTKKRDAVDRFAQWSELGRMQKISLYMPTLRSTGLAKLLEGNLGSVRALRLLHCGIGTKGASLLAKKTPPRLAELSLTSDYYLENAGYESIATLPLTALQVSHCAISTPGVKAITSMKLERLALDGTRIGVDGAEMIADSRALASLRELSLDGAQIGDAGVIAIASSPHLANLRRLKLNLYGNDLGPDSARALATSPYLKDLQELDLGFLPRTARFTASDLEQVRAVFGDRVKLYEPDVPARPPTLLQRIFRRWF